MNPHGYAPPPPSTSSTGWRVRHSLWLLAPVLGFGYLSFVGFVYVAIRLRHSRLAWVVAGISVVLTLVVWVAIISTLQADGTFAVGASVSLVLLWFVSIGGAVGMNVHYLRMRARWPAQGRPVAYPVQPAPTAPPPYGYPVPGFSPPGGPQPAPHVEEPPRVRTAPWRPGSDHHPR